MYGGLKLVSGSFLLDHFRVSLLGLLLHDHQSVLLHLTSLLHGACVYAL